jgi:hypothetical protein
MVLCKRAGDVGRWVKCLRHSCAAVKVISKRAVEMELMLIAFLSRRRRFHVSKLDPVVWSICG